MTEYSQPKAYTRRRGDVTPDGKPSSIWYRGQMITFLAEAQDTVGQIMFLEGLVPKGFGPPPHIHTREDEAMYVVEGSLKFYVEDEVFEAPPGTFVYLPKRKVHWFTLDTDEARLLSFTVPGGNEGFFRGLGEVALTLSLPPRPPAGPPPPEWMEKANRIGEEYGIIFPRPPQARAGGESSNAPGKP